MSRRNKELQPGLFLDAPIEILRASAYTRSDLARRLASAAGALLTVLILDVGARLTSPQFASGLVRSTSPFDAIA